MINSLKNRSVKFAATCLLLTSTLGAATYSMADTSTPTTATAPAAEAAGIPTPPPQPANTVTVSNPYGLQALWNGGDLIAKSTLFILVIMSIGSWYIIMSKLLEQAKLSKQGKEAERHFWEADSLDKAPDNLTTGSAYRFIAEKGIGATRHHGDSLLERIDFNTWVTISIQRAIEKVQNHLSGGLAFLATVGSTAPFVGLFGTVWGIYNALTAIGIAGQASIDKVAGPVGEALIMTAIGLAVAVPAVLGYNWLVRRNKSEMEKVRSFGSDLHSVILSGDINKVSK
jgi:biopolymer transport protein ExbB